MKNSRQKTVTYSVLTNNSHTTGTHTHIECLGSCVLCPCSVASDSFVAPWTSPPGSSVRGISQARTLEWAAIPFSRGLPSAGIHAESLKSPSLAGRFLITGLLEKPSSYCEVNGIRLHLGKFSAT